MFGQETYSAARVKLEKGDRLVLYTDGLSEARDEANVEYGDDRLPSVLHDCQTLPARALIDRLLSDVQEFSSNVRTADDLTLMAIEMVGH
jgi:sigma-B regulation protein RsbU (phosphoserine phosphatase)